MKTANSDTLNFDIAVTGAGGFLGGAITRALADDWSRIVAFGRHAPGIDHPHVTPRAWDGRTPAQENVRADIVVDCAAVIPARAAHPDLLMTANVALARGAIGLAGRSRGKLIFMSSQSVIGRVDAPVIDSSTPCAPDTPYGQAKLRAERMMAEAVNAGALTGAIALRLPAVVGVGCHNNFPATAAARLAAGEPVTLFNPDAPYNAVIHAESMARFVQHLAQSMPTGFHAISLASTPPIRVVDAVQALADGMDVMCQTDIAEAPHASPTIDPSTATALGYEPEAVDAVLRRYGAETRIAIATSRPPR